MDSLFTDVESTLGFNCSGSNVKVSNKIQNFWNACPKDVKEKLREIILDIQSKMNFDENLFIVNWIESSAERSAVLLAVRNTKARHEDCYRMILSFHAPEYEFYCSNSDFRRCLVKDERWQKFLIPLIGFEHRLDK